MAMSPQQFCLRWNNHQSNIISVFEHLLQTEAFVDVSLAVEGMTLKAHKVVLSACSPYFQAVLASHPDKHPVVILKDVRYSDMRDLLDFMYRGEVSVDQDNLSGFLRVATSLRIKGLTEVNEKKHIDPAQSPFLFQQTMAGLTTPGMVPVAPLTPIAGDPPPLKRSPLSPMNSYGAKRRRGRPPKISGEESEGEIGSIGGSVSAPEGDDTRSEAEVKVEIEDTNDTQDTEEPKDTDLKNDESVSAGPSGESQSKEVTRSTKEDPETTRDSTGSGSVAGSNDWGPHDYSIEENGSGFLGNGIVTHQSSSHLSSLPGSPSKPSHQAPPCPPLTPHPPPRVTDITELYYTKNLLEAAMLKNPYDALKNSKNLQGSILLASLRAPLRAAYPERDERDHVDSSPHSPLTSSQKPSQSSPTLSSPGSGSHSNSSSNSSSTHNNNNNSNTTNNNNSSSRGVSVPIMSYCIQDNGFKCSRCFQTFTHPSNFHRHYITVHTDRRAHKCHVCGKEFKRKDNMMSHIRSVHRPGKEGYSIKREMIPESPTIPSEFSIPAIPEQLLQHVDQV